MLNHVEIVQQLKADKRKAFNMVYYEYYEMLLYVGSQYVADMEDVKEAVQDAFVKLWENRKGLKEDSNIRNFLYTIVKNNCLNILKKNEVILKSQERLEWKEMQYRYEAFEPLEFNNMEFEELKDIIEKAIDRLPEHCKRVFKLSRFEQLKYKEIAEELGISEKTVEGHMTKAIKLLKEDLKYYLSFVMLISDILK